MSSIGTAVISMSRCECRMLCLISHRKVFESIPMVCNRCQKGGYGRYSHRVAAKSTIQPAKMYSKQSSIRILLSWCTIALLLPGRDGIWNKNRDKLQIPLQNVVGFCLFVKLLGCYSSETNGIGPGQAAWKMCPS